MPIKEWLSYVLKWSVIGGLTGVLAGSASAIFLIALEWITGFREQREFLLWLLPFGGLLVGWIYHRYGARVERGNDLIIDEVHDPKATIPLRMTPMVLLGTLLTHLFGGSAGREGTAVQMGGSIADQLAKPFRLKNEDRRILLMAGMSAGFGSVFGVPFAGAVFGLEVLTVGRLRLRPVCECTLASFVGHYTCLAWGVHHTSYAPPLLSEISVANLMWTALAGVAFGICARVFSETIHFVSRNFKKIPWPAWRPFLGGILVSGGYRALGSLRFAGLGVPTLQKSLTESLPPFDFAWKFLFTILTLGSGFKGGEVTPLLFVGATLGNSLASVIPLSFSQLAAVGFVAVFAGAANTPWACAIMAMELFGPHVGIFALVACWVSYSVSGYPGIYKAQARA